MKAALLKAASTIEVEDVPVPEISEGTALLRVKACGICGSDLKFYNHIDRVNSLPRILGHEVAGEVVGAGEKVSGLRTGDRIALANEIPCRQCYACRKGLENVCENTSVVGVTIDGGFSEYMLLTEQLIGRGPVNRMPESITFEEAALAEPLGCVVNGLEFARMDEGKSVLVIGTGPIGCMIINLAQNMGASKIVAVEKNPKRLEMARPFGADHYIYAEKGFLQEALELTHDGYDVVMVATGDIGVQEEGIKAAAKGGFVNLFGGVAKGLPDTVTFSNKFLHYRQFAVGGSFSQTKEQHRKALEYLAKGKIKTDKLITHRFGLDDIKKAIDAVQNQEGLKVMVKP